jgi:hypothetical protein
MENADGHDQENPMGLLAAVWIERRKLAGGGRPVAATDPLRSTATGSRQSASVVSRRPTNDTRRDTTMSKMIDRMKPYLIEGTVNGEAFGERMANRHEAIDAARAYRYRDPGATVTVTDEHDGEEVFSFAPAEVGMPATLCHINDRYPGQITAIRRNGREIDFGHGENDEGSPFTLRRNGFYVAKGADSFPYLMLGVALSYRAPEI